MGLIDVVKKAQTLDAAKPSEDAGLLSLYPSWADHDAGLQEQLVTWASPSINTEDSNPIKQRMREEEDLVAALEGQFDAPDSPPLLLLDGLLSPYLQKQLPGNPLAEADRNRASGFRTLLQGAAPQLGQRLVSALVRFCIARTFWDGLQSIVESRALTGNSHPELVSALVEHDQALILCMWLRQVPDPRFPDLLLVLKYFLKCMFRGSKALSAIRHQWRSLALSFVGKIAKVNEHPEAQRGSRSSRRRKKKASNEDATAAILLAAAVDQFQPYELCLHELVASGQDESVLISMLSQLDTNEVLRLLLYLEKWLRKYSRQSVLYASHSKKRDFHVPSLAQIIQWTSVLIDSHFTTLVLCSDFHVKLCTIQNLVKGLVEAGYKFAPLIGITEHIRENGPLPSEGSASGDADHVIEFLEF